MRILLPLGLILGPLLPAWMTVGRNFGSRTEAVHFVQFALVAQLIAALIAYAGLAHMREAKVVEGGEWMPDFVWALSTMSIVLGFVLLFFAALGAC